MNYIQMAGILEGLEENPAHKEHVWQFTQLCEQCIKDLCPQIVKEELANMDKDLIINLKTQINGRNYDFPEIRRFFREMLEDELRKMLKEMKL